MREAKLGTETDGFDRADVNEGGIGSGGSSWID